MARKRVSAGKKIAVTLVVSLAAAAIWGGSTLASPYEGFRGQAVIDIERGSGTRQIAAMLKNAGVIRYEWHLLAARLLRPRTPLQAGEYRFDEPATVFGVFDRLARGDTFFYEVLIPEGSNMYEIAAILDKSGIITGKAFLLATTGGDLIHDLAPQATSLEGYLFPATYRLGKHTTAAVFAKSMTDRFRRAWKALDAKGDVHSTVTLASLVEKETSVGEERPVVASVFTNRLQRGMKLDCDPTTIYASLLQGTYRGTIYKSDLNSQHPYNTYQHPGLPPGPIANPGQKSLEAAVHPASTEYLYFVAKANRSGGHVFSTNMADHQKAVAEYRRGQQKGKVEGNSRPVHRTRKSTGD